MASRRTARGYAHQPGEQPTERQPGTGPGHHVQRIVRTQVHPRHARQRRPARTAPPATSRAGTARRSAPTAPTLAAGDNVMVDGAGLVGLIDVDQAVAGAGDANMTRDQHALEAMLAHLAGRPGAASLDVATPPA